MRDLYIDLGNTKLKIYQFEQKVPKILLSHVINKNDTDDTLISQINKFVDNETKNIKLINVNFKFQKITNYLYQNYSVMIPDYKKIIRNNMTNAHLIGSDILACISGVEVLKLKQPLTIINLGSYITITKMINTENNRTFIESINILPGIQKQLETIKNLISFQPDNFNNVKDIYEKGFVFDNDSAIVCGIINTVKKGVIADKNDNIVVTGGDAWIFQNSDHLVIDDLAIIGLKNQRKTLKFVEKN